MPRTITSAGVAAIVAAGLLVSIATTAAARDLTVATWGGVYTKFQRQAIFDPFTKKSGKAVLDDGYTGGLAKVKAMTETGNVTWDIVQVETPELIRGCEEGLFVKLDHSKLSNGSDMMPGGLSACGIGSVAWSLVISFDQDKVDKGNRSWADFWNVAKYPGKRALRRGPKLSLEAALLADGVAGGEVYKLLGTKAGVDRAFAKLDEIKGNLLWWEKGAQPPEWLAAGTVVMSTAYPGRIHRAAQEGKNLGYSWNGTLFAVDSWVIVKGTPNLDLAYQFLDFATEPGPQAAFANLFPAAPVNLKGIPLMDPGRDKLMSTGDNLKQGVAIDNEFWVDNEEELSERFNAWVSK